MLDADSLVATRARRANAGSRLKQLIEIEGLASDAQAYAMTEDDENVQLLFQEDENDEEFNEDDNDDEEGDSNGDDKEGGEDGETASDPESANGTPAIPGTETASDTERNFNDDEMFSDSDLSLSEDDNTGGESELEKQERASKRKKKPTAFMPAIKKPKPKPETAKPVPKPVVRYSEILLMSERRSSSRKSALRNKEQLIERIKEDEKRRAALTPVVRTKERKLTQEERLAQAVETERENIESLQLFMKQEIVKKERQKWLLQLKRPKLRNVIRFISEETFVCPLDEVEDDRHVQDIYERRKNRRRRRFNEPSEERRYGDIDTELPYYKQEMEENRIRELREAEERRILMEARAIKRKRLEEERAARKKALEEERLARKTAKEQRLREFENVTLDDTIHADSQGGVAQTNDEKVDGEKQGDGGETAAKGETAAEEGENKVADDPKEGPLVKLEGEEPAGDDIPTVDHDTQKEEKGEKKSLQNPADDAMEVDEQTPAEDPEPEASEATTTPEPRQTPAQNNTEDQDVTFQEQLSAKQDTAEASPEPVKEHTAEPEEKVSFDTPELTEPSFAPEEDAENTEAALQEYFYRPSEDGTVYEGPVQHVGRNYVILMDFDEQERWGLTETKIKTTLFGEDGALTGSRRLRDVVTILRSTTRLDNPYAAPKEEKEDEMFKPVTKINEDNPMFEVLRRVPRLGDKNVVMQDVDEETSQVTTVIRIHTEAPSSLHLPNGNKKLCFISGKEVRYFDPITGIPYENKDMYKIIKEMEMGLYTWHSLGRNVNTYGSVQLYLNKREGARHAKGVPDGFDG